MKHAKLRTVSDTTDETTEDTSNDVDTSEETIVLPWWHHRGNLISVLIAAILLAAGAGFVIGERNATPQPNAVDIGYLQDMRAHHEQAVEMALIYIAKPGTNSIFHVIAKEIAFGQAVDIGRMIQLLRDYGQAEANESGTAMVWMNHPPVPLDRMPGLATPSDLDSFIAAKGSVADKQFVALMVAHHEGGIHMADFAAKNAATSEVRAMAAASRNSQQGEIAELKQLLAQI
jgi:hypothetical protein